MEIVQSAMASRTLNPLRILVDGTKIHPNPEKQLISLQLGDPTVGGNLLPDAAILESLNSAIASGRYNGYGPAVGLDIAREAVANFVCDDHFAGHESWGECDGWRLKMEDVVMTNGCSGALEMCLGVLVSEGQNVLIPHPGFSLYRTFAQSLGFGVKTYNLLPENEWRVDLKHLESLADENTAAIIVNNPSNPCGSVYTREHLIDIVAVARRKRLPIIADEVYAHMVFEGEQYIPIGAISGDVPVLHCGALSKTWLVPGWRMGWVALWDRTDALKQVRRGLFSLAVRLMGPNTLVQAAIPDILLNTPRAFYERTNQVCRVCHQ